MNTPEEYAKNLEKCQSVMQLESVWRTVYNDNTLAESTKSDLWAIYQTHKEKLQNSPPKTRQTKEGMGPSKGEGLATPSPAKAEREPDSRPFGNGVSGSPSPVLEQPNAKASYPAPPQTSTALLIRPEVSIEDSITLWNTFKRFKAKILEDEDCYDVIEERKIMNRTGASRLAIPFGVTIEERFMQEDMINGDKRFIVHVRASKGERFQDGVGSCRVSEIPDKIKPYSKREHFTLTKAWTRAQKRALADLLGGVEADEE